MLSLSAYYQENVLHGVNNAYLCHFTDYRWNDGLQIRLSGVYQV